MIDWVRVAELRDEVGEDAFAEVVGLFLEEVDASIAQLRPDLGDEELAAEFHSLKGAALNLGLRDMSALCGAAEARAGARARDPDDVSEVAACYARSRRVFVAGLSERFGLDAA